MLTNKKLLFHLQKNSNIIVKPANKGGNIVILDLMQYASMCEKI